MTTIITRLYADAATANAVVSALLTEGHSQSTIDVILRDGGTDLEGRMRMARISPDAAAAYAKQMKGSGKALLVVRAGFNPVGAARNALKVTARYPSLGAGLADEDQYVREDVDGSMRSSVMRGGPLMMSNPFRPAMHGHIMGNNLISAPRTKRSAMAGGGFMSGMFWPMRLVSSPAKTGTSAIRGGKLYLTSLLKSR